MEEKVLHIPDPDDMEYIVQTDEHIPFWVKDCYEQKNKEYSVGEYRELIPRIRSGFDDWERYLATVDFEKLIAYMMVLGCLLEYLQEEDLKLHYELQERKYSGEELDHCLFLASINYILIDYGEDYLNEVNSALDKLKAKEKKNKRKPRKRRRRSSL